MSPREVKILDSNSMIQTAPTLVDVARHWSKKTWGFIGIASGILAATILVLIMVATGLLTFTLSGLVTLSPASVAKQIVADLESQGITATVECPSSLVAPTGFSFVCMAQGEDASVAQVNVTIVDSNGEIGWHLLSDLPQKMTQ
jgi:hypothetical protein